VVAEQDPPVGRLEVDVVVQPLSRGGPVVVDAQHPVGDEPGVEPVGDGVRAQADTISQTALTDSPLARARMPQATAPSRAMAIQTAIRRGVRRPVAGVAVAFM
jgi:hypothetical protein